MNDTVLNSFLIESNIGLTSRGKRKNTNTSVSSRTSALIVFFLIFLFGNLTVFSQKNYIKAVVRDTSAKKNLLYSIASLIDEADSALYCSVRTNESGAFEISKIPPGKYLLMISYPHLADYIQKITITDTSKIDLGKIDMVTVSVLLDEVIIKSGQPIRMRGDTLEYTADSFAVKPGANVQELLKRLPGIQVDRNGKITAQGKVVEKILVDGDEFFSDDPGLASQYLNANAVDKVQVFEKKSDATEFTGIDDGTRTKTINLTLKKNKKNGSFGKLAAGSDGKKYYNHEAMASLFNGAKKVSVFGLASKTGKEGISYNELSKYVGQDYERIEDGTGNMFINTNEYENENYYGNGLPAVLSGGAYYSNKWKDGKQKFYGNYRIKQIDAEGWNTSRGTTQLPDGTGFINQTESRERSSNFTQKASGNFTATLDSFSTIKISVNGNLSNGTKITSRSSTSENEKGYLVNNSNQTIKGISDGGRFGGNINYQRRFRKIGRTLSLVAQQDYNEANTENYNYSLNNYFDPASGTFKKTDTLDQLQTNNKLNKMFAAKLAVTENLSKEIRLSIEYGWKTSVAKNKFYTYANDSGAYTSQLAALSNDYDFTINTHIAGTSIGWNKKKINLTIGAKIYFTGFNQVNNDLKTARNRNFTNLAPHANIGIRLKSNSGINIYYLGQTIQPTTDQLQPLRKSSNPLFVQIGNPNLLPGFRHDASVNYNFYNWVKGHNFYASCFIGYIENGISSRIIKDAQNKTTTQYINLNGVPSINGNLNYSREFKKIHLRPSVGMSFGTNGSNSFLNGVLTKNQNNYGSCNFSLSYDLKNILAAGYSGSVNRSKGRSNIDSNLVPATISHTHFVNITGYLPGKFELVSDCAFNFQPANSTFNSSFNTIRWNASLSKRLLKDDKGFVRLSVNDILNENTGYNRSVYGNNVNESDRLTIKRYFLLTLGWDFSKSIK